MNLQEAIQTYPTQERSQRWVLYALIDPRTKQVRYVGQTKAPRRRFLAYARGAVKTNSWLLSWLKKDTPLVEILGVYSTKQEADDNERDWIADLRSAFGKVLLNIDDGGSGVPQKGRVFSKEHRRKLSEAAKRREYSPEECEARRQRTLKQWADPEFQKRYVGPWKGKTQPLELVEKRRQKLIGQRRSPQAVENLRRSHNTPETKEKCRQAALKRWNQER